MREIKFRAWNKEEKEMVYWDGFFEVDDGCCFAGEHFIYNLSEVPVMQYTGLKDKNDKEIYEGDVVQFKYANFKKLKISQIAWGTVGFWIVGWFNILQWAEHHQVEVIGNIYENPELLEVEK